MQTRWFCLLATVFLQNILLFIWIFRLLITSLFFSQPQFECYCELVYHTTCPKQERSCIYSSLCVRHPPIHPFQTNFTYMKYKVFSSNIWYKLSSSIALIFCGFVLTGILARSIKCLQMAYNAAFLSNPNGRMSPRCCWTSLAFGRCSHSVPALTPVYKVIECTRLFRLVSMHSSTPTNAILLCQDYTQSNPGCSHS